MRPACSAEVEPLFVVTCSITPDPEQPRCHPCYQVMKNSSCFRLREDLLG